MAQIQAKLYLFKDCDYLHVPTGCHFVGEDAKRATVFVFNHHPIADEKEILIADFQALKDSGKVLEPQAPIVTTFRRQAD